MQTVKEVYDVSLDWQTQIKEPICWHVGGAMTQMRTPEPVQISAFVKSLQEASQEAEKALLTAAQIQEAEKKKAEEEKQAAYEQELREWAADIWEQIVPHISDAAKAGKWTYDVCKLKGTNTRDELYTDSFLYKEHSDFDRALRKMLEDQGFASYVSFRKSHRVECSDVGKFYIVASWDPDDLKYQAEANELWRLACENHIETYTTNYNAGTAESYKICRTPTGSFTDWRNYFIAERFRIEGYNIGMLYVSDEDAYWITATKSDYAYGS
jgi:hypothetical protein